ncbi:MAG TPA: hypothetical protein VFK11_01010 [Candidatus Saccharimonadales bacterium]|nr:hypothetical protein [Candidatus Saccharimonadales bacterium]
MTKAQIKALIQEYADAHSGTVKIGSETLAGIIEKAISGKEIDENNLVDSIDKWFINRFSKRLVYIDEKGYAQMCIDALKILKTTAATDYGSSRQRDLGQLWGDMTRGYLAEYALAKFLSEKWNMEVELGHEVGELLDYLPSDIHSVKKPGEEKRNPNIQVGIKGSKWNGIWLDIPGAQFNHSDVHIFVKVGTARDHLFAYFKHISVFKDKILKKGVEVGSINDEEASVLYDNLPTFEDIPAYIVGFAIKDKKYSTLSYAGKKGRTRFIINEWNGPIFPGDSESIKHRESISGKVEFEGIGKFSHESGYLFNTGSLLWQDSDWKKYLIDKL